MAKKKGKGKKKGGYKRRASTKKKTTRRSKPKTPIGASVGTGVTVYRIATKRTPLSWASPIDQLFADRTLMENIKFAFEAAVQNAKATENIGPLLVGLGVSYGEDVPVVGPLYKGMIKRPADRLLGKLERALTKKKPKLKW